MTQHSLDLTTRLFTIPTTPAVDPDSLLWHVERAAAAYDDAIALDAAYEYGATLAPRVGPDWWRPEYAPLRDAARWAHQHPRHPVLRLAAWHLPQLRYYAKGDVLISRDGNEKRVVIAGLQDAGPLVPRHTSESGPSPAQFWSQGLIAVGIEAPTSPRPFLKVAFFPWATVPDA